MIGKRTFVFDMPVDWPIRGQLLVTTFEDEAPMIAWRQDSGTVWGVSIDGKETTPDDPAKAEARASLRESIREAKDRHPASGGIR